MILGEEMKFGKYEVVFDKNGLPQQVFALWGTLENIVGDKFMYLVLRN